jgi:hypothetical protein
MTTKSFGTLLMIVSLFIGFALFAFSDWNGRIGFIQNVRYAALIELSPETYSSGLFIPAKNVTLAHGLLFSLLLFCSGLIIKLGLVESSLLTKWLPFLK